MGMFDYVKCEQPLPDGWDLTNDHVGLQTKDFDCEMVTIRITSAGRLEVERYEWETVPMEERPHPNDPALSFVGSLRAVNRRWEDMKFHGEFNFGGLEVIGREPENERGYRRPIFKSHDYTAKFTDGQFVSLTDDNAESAQ